MDHLSSLSRLQPATRRQLDRAGQVLIAGRWVDTSETIAVIDPSSELEISRIAAADTGLVNLAVEAAADALRGDWSKTPPARREHLLSRLADLIGKNADVLAELESIDVGMPITMARSNVIEGTIATIRYMSGWPTKISGETFDVGLPIPDAAYFGYSTREPVGVVAAITPWNMPLMLAAWKIAPALAAGCTVVLKPSEDACLSVLLLAELAVQAGFPPGVINMVTGTGAVVGEALVRHPAVDKVTFTGSTATGRRVAEIASQSLKKATLELGGKSPQLLFADADLAYSIPQVANSVFLNSGQICVAGSRLYVQRPVFSETVERLTAYIATLKIGPGLDPSTQIGPLATASQRSRVKEYLANAKGEGASLIGTAYESDRGYFVAPTLVVDAHQTMQIVQEEVFGPILTIMPFDDIDQAIALANDSAFGLSANIWTRDISTAHHVISKVRSGKVTVNTDPIPYPALPEGGRKASGYGRDLGKEALDGFLETKSVLIRYK